MNVTGWSMAVAVIVDNDQSWDAAMTSMDVVVVMVTVTMSMAHMTIITLGG